MQFFDTVILTGFAGFIGNRILSDLIQKGYYVIGVDNMSMGSSIENFNNITSPNFFPMFEDISDPNLLKYLKTAHNLEGKEIGI